MKNIYISLLVSATVLISTFSSAQKAPIGDIYLHMLTNGEPVATRYLGDQLNSAGTWFIQFEVGQDPWYQTDAGIGSDYMDDATWIWRTAGFYQDGTYPNKRVQADFGNFRFTQVGYWYFAGRAKGASGDPFHYANSTTWGNDGTLLPLYYFQVDAINGVGSALAQQNSGNPSSAIDLTWIKNEQGHNVMIVRKKIYQSWTEPTQGTAYNPGNPMGDGVVVYNSSGEAFTNTGLASSTDYDYKFYSVNNNYYSEGIYNSAISTYTAFASGDGTAGNPFQVANPDALNCVRHYTTTMSMTDGNFIQTADIDLSGVYAAGEGWMPIDELRGSYNGQGHTINHLTINKLTNDYVGLFAQISTGIISNLGLINVNLTGKNKLGAIAATLGSGSPPVIVQMENCYSTGSITVSSGGAGGWDVGGLVGYLRADINRCFSSCSVTNNYPAGWQYVGGLVGTVEGCTVKNCYATGAVTAAVNFYRAVGGLIGRAGNVTIEKCFATGLISTPDINTYTFVDGIAGRFEGASYYIGDFYDKETTGLAFGMPMPGLEGLTTAEMKTAGTFLAANWDFSSTGDWAINGTTNSGYPYLRYQGAEPAYIWSGASTTSWGTAGNWSENTVPASDKTVIIPDVTNDPVISSAEAVTNLTIESSGLLTISKTGSLTVSGELINSRGSDGLIVKADATGFGSLIENSSATATVESYISENKWHFISSPVAGLSSGIFETQYLQQHTEAGGFVDVPELDLSLATARGFALWGGNTGSGGLMVNYCGSLNTGTIPVINVTRTAGGETRGWNLIGNPYASALDWDLVEKSNVNTAIYIENAGGWAIYNNGVGVPSTSTKYIAPGQGFFVQVTDGTLPASGTVSITNDDRIHTATTFFKNSEVSDLIRLQLSGNKFTDEAVVRFAPDASSGFDGNYDAHKFFSETADFAQLYTLGNSPLAINALQPETGSVPLCIRAGAAGTYNLAATDLRNIPIATLEDTQTGIFTDLTTNSYSFNCVPGENEVRFILHFASVTSVNEPPKAISTVYSTHKTVVINMPEQVRGDIYIYNIAGQLVATKLSAEGKTDIGLPVTGNYIVKVITKDNSIVKKVFVR